MLCLECFPKHNSVVADSVHVIALPLDVFVYITISRTTFVVTSTKHVLVVGSGWQHVVFLMTPDVVANK